MTTLPESTPWDAIQNAAGAINAMRDAETKEVFHAAAANRAYWLDWLSRGGSKSADSPIVRLPRSEPSAPSTLPTPRAANDNQRRKPFELTWFDEIEEGEPKECVIQGAFGVGDFSTVSGKPGSGKSVILTDGACHVAAGLEWHGRKVKKGLVVYVAAERKKLTERRMNAFRKHYQVKDVPLLVLGGQIDLTTNLIDAKALTAAINNAATECGETCVWIIIDTLTRTFGAGDQNTSKDMTKFVNACDEIRIGTGAHVTVVHHTTWESERGKGAIDLDGAVDESFLVKKTGKTYALECNGTNDGEEGLIVEFDIMSVEIGIDSNGDASTAPVVRRVESVAADLVAATLASAGSRKSLEALRLAIVEKGIPPEGSSYPDGAMVVTEDAWRSRFYATDPEAKPDTMAKRFKRAKTELIEKGKVINIGSWFWPQ